MRNRTGNANAKFKNRFRQGNSSIFKRRFQNAGVSPNKMLDARQKIILQKRKTVTDAREVLAKMAKTQDARSKLLKIRETKKNEGLAKVNVRIIGSNILQKTDCNGKISLITSKNKQSTKDINLAIQQQLGLISPKRKAIPKLASVNDEILHRSVPPNLIRKTIINDLDPVFDLPYDYLNSAARVAPRRDPISSRIHHLHLSDRSRLVDSNVGDWRPYLKPYSRSPIRTSGYIDLDAPEDEEMPLVSPPKQPMFIQSASQSSSIHSRLDTVPIQSQSHGIFAQPTKTKVVVPAGHRIVVSNLQQTVTQDDIRELFEDIGQLLVARLVRPGTAEVIYKNLKDAQKAVDTYHNRQLDGQPMKCFLVNKRPLNNPTGPAIHCKSSSATSLTSLSKKAGTTKITEKLVPDLQTIHKVLFQRN